MRPSVKKIFEFSQLSRKSVVFLSGVFLSFFLFAVGLSLVPEKSPRLSDAPASSISSELNIADSSPLGDTGGLVVPASCPSDLHDAPLYGTVCTSTRNACGQYTSGTFNCAGACSASAPALPPLYGTACTSAANTCGMVNSGTILCSGACSASRPSNALCGPPTLRFEINPLPIFPQDAGSPFTLLSDPSANVARCTASDGWTGDKGSGWETTRIFPLVTTIYSLECWDAMDNSTGKKSVQASIRSVIQAPPALHICPDTSTISVGSTQRFIAKFTTLGSDFISCAASGTDVSSTTRTNWSSSNTGVATIDNTGNNFGNRGLATGRGAGSATINLTYRSLAGVDYAASANITVNAASGVTCPAVNMSVDGVSTVCNYAINVGATAVGTSYTTNTVNSPAGYTGSASFVCGGGGNWQYLGETCNPPAAATDCSNQAQTWTVSGRTCSGTTGLTPDGSIANVVSTNGNSGTRPYSCSAATGLYTGIGTGTCGQPAVCGDFYGAGQWCVLPATLDGASINFFSGPPRGVQYSCVNAGVPNTCTAYNPAPPNYTLRVNSSGVTGATVSGVWLGQAPANNNFVGGTTNYAWSVPSGSNMVFTAPLTVSGFNFSSWSGCTTTSGATCNLTISADTTVTANYLLPACTPTSTCLSGTNPATAANTCSNTTFSINNGCTNVDCPGTRSCDYNWKEVAP